MLCFALYDLQQHAAMVDGRLAGTDPVWQEGDPLPVSTVRATGRLSRAGSNRFYWSGRIEGETVLPCRRCLTSAELAIGEDVHAIFAEADDAEVDDPDVFRIGTRAQELDLRPAIREQWLLAVPPYALCRDDCKGLCARCGADLNAGPCACDPVTDSRWDALRRARPHSE